MGGDDDVGGGGGVCVCVGKIISYLDRKLCIRI